MLEKEYQFKRTSGLRFLIYLIVVALIFISIFVLITDFGFSIFLLPIGFFALLAPVFFQKKFKNLINKGEGVIFNNDGVAITEYDFKEGTPLNKVCINWNDIKSYNYSRDPRSKYHNIILTLNNGKTKSLSFDDEREDIEVMNDENSAFGVFHSFVKKYNDNHSVPILVNMGFFGTAKWNIIIWIVAFIALSVFIFFLIQNAKLSLIPLISGIGLVLQFMNFKKQGVDMYNKINALN